MTVGGIRNFTSSLARRYIQLSVKLENEGNTVRRQGKCGWRMPARVTRNDWPSPRQTWSWFFETYYKIISSLTLAAAMFSCHQLNNTDTMKKMNMKFKVNWIEKRFTHSPMKEVASFYIRQVKCVLIKLKCLVILKFWWVVLRAGSNIGQRRGYSERNCLRQWGTGDTNPPTDRNPVPNWK